MLAVVVWQLATDDTYVAPRPGAAGTPAQADPTAAGAALRDLAQRIDDAPAGGAAGAEDDPVAYAVANAGALRVEDFSARYVSESGAVSAAGAWTASVDMTWRFAGFDRRPVRQTVTVSFRTEDGRTRITGFGGGAARSPVWLSGPLEVRRSAGTLVLLRGDSADADRYHELAREAVDDVRDVLPWPRPRLVLEVPADRAGFEAALGAGPGTYAGVAAVTASVDGSAEARSPVHVFVNPAVIGSLTGRGAEVVVSHEATHVATGAATGLPAGSAMPVWLLEGFADYVALRDIDLPLSTTAGQVLAQVRADGPPDHLPGRAEFDSGSESFSSEYESAWLACRVLAERGGQDALVALYDEVLTGTPLEPALQRHFGFGVDGLTRLWQARLTDWAR